MAVKYSPYMAFRFQVEAENNGVILASFSKFSGVKVSVETIQVRSGSDIRGVRESVPVLTHYEPVTLTRGVIASEDFIQWVLHGIPRPEAGIKGGKKLYRTLNVIALNRKGQRASMWSLKNALPIGYELYPMDAGDSEVLFESLTFSIAGMQRKDADLKMATTGHEYRESWGQ